ncbi:hypothetical protein BACI71_30967 [Bacillus mycoides]|uniref:Uncharacterized protein n=1 Tax=Bacillus mycoides TaxID=1405 RepID=A0A653YTD3_BACMY|nr:hypothetical protein BACI71_30967 [Bacillus mycoides]
MIHSISHFLVNISNIKTIAIELNITLNSTYEKYIYDKLIISKNI